MSEAHVVKTLGLVTFGGDGDGELPLFRVQEGVPLDRALEQISNVLYCAKGLALEASLEEDTKRQAWAAHYLCEMGKAIVDDLRLSAERGDL